MVNSLFEIVFFLGLRYACLLVMSLAERVLRNYVDKRKKKINAGLSLEGSKMEGGAGVEEDPTSFPLYTPSLAFPRTAISRISRK